MPPPLTFDNLKPAQLAALREQVSSSSGALSDSAMDCVRADLIHALEADESVGQFRARLRDSLDAVGGGPQ